MITIQVNGAARELPEAVSISALLTTLGYDGRPVAVAVNHLCVKRSEHVTAVVRDGDEIEILAPMAGG